MQSVVTGTLQDSFTYRFISSRGTEHTQSQSSCTVRLLFTYSDYSRCRYEHQEYQIKKWQLPPSSIHPNYLLWIYTRHSQTPSQPSRWLRYTCMLHKATTTHSSGLLHLLPSLYQEGMLGWRSEWYILLLMSHCALFRRFSCTKDMLATLLCDLGVKAERAVTV